MSITALPVPSLRIATKPLPGADLVSAVVLTGLLIIATVTTTVAGPVPRIGAAFVDLGILALVGRRVHPLAAAAATMIVVITGVMTAPDALRAPALIAVVLAVYAVVRYESGIRLLAGLLICAVGLGAARLMVPEFVIVRGVGLTQLEVVLVLVPAITAALIRLRGRLPGLLVPGAGLVQPSNDHPKADHLEWFGGVLGRAASWMEFGRLNRDRMLTTLAASLTVLVVALHAGDSGAVVRDIATVSLAVIAVGSVALVGRWPWPALLLVLIASISFTGVAELPTAYNDVIGGVVVIGLPLMFGVMLATRPALVALGVCATAIVVMGGVADIINGTATATANQVLSSVAMAVGGWTAGRVVRAGGIAVRSSVLAPAQDAEAVQPGRPHAERLAHQAELLGLRPTVRFDPEAGPAAVPAEITEVISEVLQEAVINASRYAPGADLLISVRREDRGVRVEVVNGRPTEEVGYYVGPGDGVPRLARRVVAVRGMLAVGPYAGGYAVRAWFGIDPARN
jgi:hypothetical protein